MKKRRTIIVTAVAAAILLLLVWAIVDNYALELNRITVSGERLPEAFDGFRIAHVSDLHNAEMGTNNEKLIAMLRQAEPDIIAITGDLMDSRDTDPSVALHFCREAVKIAPVYYITGNHEVRLDSELYTRLLNGLKAAGVTVFEDTSVILTRDDASICLAGHQWGRAELVAEITDFDGYKILLSHTPEDLPVYAAAGYDLVLSGHAHGGQFRLPFIGGLFAPGQGFFPKYDSGLYQYRDTQMVVSRGIGNSLFPLRFNNPPEVILITLEA
ncbi:MAG: metallophosphoesterase [Ruminococcaceae bacterium]|nr:metallophosphoesterase [Oscillospiraceae bacterium]